jgi:hypothetical protein
MELVRASIKLVRASMAPEPRALEATVKAPAALVAFGSALVEVLPAVDLARLQSAQHERAPAGLSRRA